MTDAPAPTRRPLDTGLLPGRGAAETTFRAMGSDAHVVLVDAPPGLLAVARDLVGRLEAHWSPFRPDSDVSRLARAEGSWVSVHADTHVLLERCRVGWELNAVAARVAAEGAITKGLAADLGVEWLLEHGAGGAMVNVGGDLRAASQPPAPGGWGIEVAVPASATTVTLVVADAGIATSTPATSLVMGDHRPVRSAGGTGFVVVDDQITSQPGLDEYRR